MKMRKIVAIFAAVLMLFSILPFSAFAADTEIVFELGANGSASHKDGSSNKSTYSEKNGDYTLSLTSGTNMYPSSYDAKGNSCIKLGASSKAGGFSFTVPADVTSVIIAAGKYKSNTTKLSVNGTTHTLTKNSNDGAYDAITVDTTTNKTITLTTVSGGYRAMINTITFVIAAGDADCEHVWVDADCTTPKTCSECGATEGEALGHDWEIISEEEATCTANGSTTYECAACGESKTEAIPALPHNYVEGFCSVCGAKEPILAEYTITFDAAKTQRTEWSTTKQVWKNGPVTFTNNKSGSQTNVADYGAPVRLYQGSEIVIECIGMTQIVFNCNSTDYATALKNSIGSAATASGKVVTVAVSENTLTATLGAQVRIDSLTVTAEVADAATCEHENAKACDAYCPDCGELISEGATHVSNAQYPCYAGTCIYCDEAIAAKDHILDENDICTVCGLAPTPENPVDPENPQKYVFSEFAAGTQYAVNEKHFLDNAVTVITSQAHFTEELRIYSSDTNNSTVVIKSKKDISAIVLNAGNKADVLNVYISEDGEVYSAIAVTKTTYNDYTLLIPEMTKYIKLDVAGENQIRVKAMTLYFDGEAPHTCEFVGEVTKAPTCTENGVMTYSCTCGETYEEVIVAKHNYVDGICSVCGAEQPLEATITFGEDKAQRTEFSDTTQKWENDGLVLINNLGNYTSGKIGDYSNPVRLYQGTEVIISFPGMISLVIDAVGVSEIEEGEVKYLWDATLAEAGLTYTEANGIYTITFTEPTDSITLTMVKQARANSITAYGVKPACQHEYNNACDVDCNLCGEIREAAEHVYFDDCSAICEVCGYEREVSHNVVHVEAKAATCGANGNIEHWYCDICGMAWLDANCIMNTNLRAVVLPATGEHVYFDDCSAICEVCGYEREVSHNVVHVEAKAATCGANGNIEHWYCDICGMAWLDANCIMNTNLRAVVLPATGEHTYDDEYDADCNVCGAEREVPEKPVDIIYGDANGDGAVNINDVILLQKYIAKWDVTLDEASADANADGSVNINDVILLQKYIAKWDVTLG